jgi:hypothetical protein
VKSLHQIFFLEIKETLHIEYNEHAKNSRAVAYIIIKRKDGKQKDCMDSFHGAWMKD